jgi:hypothetical protein
VVLKALLYSTNFRKVGKDLEIASIGATSSKFIAPVKNIYSILRLENFD